MNVLALELSTARGGVAFVGDNVEFLREWPNDRRNSGPFFENLMQVQKQFGSPDSIVVGLGPGSYAGIRIAISAAIGLQAASGAELLGLASICAIETETREYSVIGDARRNSFFWARIVANQIVEGLELFGESELAGKLLKHSCPVFTSDVLPQFSQAQVHYPSVRVLARLALDARARFLMPPLEPFYLREPHITLPKTGRHGIGIVAGENNKGREE